MAKILYLMHIPWGWIKQRPHFLAEGLASEHHVDVFFKKPNKVSKSNLLTSISEDNTNLHIKGFRILPFYAIPILKHMRLEWINRLFIRWQLPNFRNYDVVWLTDSGLWPYVNNIVSNDVKVIYDCMDDTSEFPDIKENLVLYKQTIKSENDLIKRANLVVCSAKYLMEKVFSRASVCTNKALVVNNAVQIPNGDVECKLPDEINQKLQKIKHLKNMMYIGAISKWFDFETVCRALDSDKKLHLVLIGPSDTLIPKHDRIIQLGTVKRDYIFNFMQYAKVLVMPFKVNELIRSVNPVKLYEYIYTGKPVIASRYGETEYFEPYVKLYRNSNEFIQLLTEIVDKSSDTAYRNKCVNFLVNNTWDIRTRVINEYLKNINIE